jgi:hypothetical protein
MRVHGRARLGPVITLTKGASFGCRAVYMIPIMVWEQIT